MSWLQYFKSSGPYFPYVVTTPISMAYKRRMRARAPMRRVRRRTRVTRRVRRTKTSNLRRFKNQMRLGVGVSRGIRNKTHTSTISPKSTAFRQAHDLGTLALYAMDATSIDKMTASFGRSDRFFQQVDFRGIKYDFLVKNNVADPIVFNYAVISFKSGKYTFEDTTWPAEPYQSPGVANDGFFRFNGDSRDENFDGSLTSQQINYSAISTDQYNIHMHKRSLLGPRPVGSDFNHQITTYRRFKGYVPIKRTLRFNDDTDDLCETPIWIVYWVHPWMANNTSTRILKIADCMQDHVSYFKQVI